MSTATEKENRLGWISDTLLPTLRMDHSPVQVLGVGARRGMAYLVGGRPAVGIHIAVTPNNPSFDINLLNGIGSAIEERLYGSEAVSGNWPRLNRGIYVDMAVPFVAISRNESEEVVNKAWITVYPAAALGYLTLSPIDYPQSAIEIASAFDDGVEISNRMSTNRTLSHTALKWGGRRNGIDIDSLSLA